MSSPHIYLWQDAQEIAMQKERTLQMHRGWKTNEATRVRKALRTVDPETITVAEYNAIPGTLKALGAYHCDVCAEIVDTLAFLGDTGTCQHCLTTALALFPEIDAP